MEELNSITEISRVIPTSGSNPVVVLADDLNEYVCKYSANTPANRLLIELLGYSFAKIWNIPIPRANFVTISPEHVAGTIIDNLIQRRCFDTPTFGSYYYSEAKEIDKTLIASWKTKKSQLNRIRNKADLLKIGLFDLWLSNEDRNHNNSNLLINPIDGGLELMVIDHEKCFNSGIINPDLKIYQINADESILNYDLIPLFFKQNAEFELLKASILDNFQTHVNNCRLELAQILQLIPDSWGINREEIEEYLNNNIFVSGWLTETEQNFSQFISNSFINS